jgi:hypothetical protein
MSVIPPQVLLAPVDLYAARPAVKVEAAPTPALVAAVSEDAGSAARVHCRRLAAPLVGAVLGCVLSPAECAALRSEAASMGYSFWAPGAPLGRN